MYTWLTHPLLDPQKSGRVLMNHLMKLVTTALQWSYAKAEEDVSAEHLEAAADQLTLRRDKIHVIDAEQVKKGDENEKQESPEEPGESKPKEKKEEKRGKKKRSSRGIRTSQSEMSPNLRPIVFVLKVRTKASQPSICVRTFS